MIDFVISHHNIIYHRSVIRKKCRKIYMLIANYHVFFRDDGIISRYHDLYIVYIILTFIFI